MCQTIYATDSFGEKNSGEIKMSPQLSVHNLDADIITMTKEPKRTSLWSNTTVVLEWAQVPKARERFSGWGSYTRRMWRLPLWCDYNLYLHLAKDGHWQRFLSRSAHSEVVAWELHSLTPHLLAQQESMCMTWDLKPGFTSYKPTYYADFIR